MIIALTGSFAAGKDMVAEYLVQKRGFRRYVYSDILRQELLAAGLEPVRENYRATGNRIRAQFGPGELSLRLLKQAQAGSAKHAVFVGVRNPEEANVLREKLGDQFQMWFVDAPVEVRYERTRQRGRSNDFASLEDFIHNEQAEDTDDPTGMHALRLGKVADAVIINDKDLDSLHLQVDKLLEALPMEKQLEIQ